MRYIFVLLILLLYGAFCWWCWWRYQRQQQRDFQYIESHNSWLIAFASQTGTAEKIALLTAQQLQAAGISIQLLPLNKVDQAQLQTYQRVLFVVSTYGEGEAPDNGNRFLRRLSDSPLTKLHYAVLALGDKNYSHFCAFGHQIHQAFHARGAQPLFDLVEVDQGDESALRHWQYFLGQLTGHSIFDDWSKPGYESWRLVERRCVNPGSEGAPVFALQLQLPATDLAAADLWAAGDIAEIGPYNDSDLPHREYSIASIPFSNTLDLLVRQVRHESGELGLGSGWLTRDASIGGDISLRIRRNSRFHAPPADAPMILIGNGTGIAGLRAHLLARAQQSATRNWLFFGERNAACDLFFADDIKQWRDTGVLTRLNLVFSRDQQSSGSPRYVQELLPLAAQDLRLWVAEGAAIFVCGSLQGMAEGVDNALAEILGRDQLEHLADTRRYCRDVY